MQANRSTPIILAQNFCPNHNILPIADIPPPIDSDFSCESNSIFRGIMHFIFGRYIVCPPFENILDRNIAIALIHPSEFIPDNPDTAPLILNELFENYDIQNRPGSLISWATLSVLIAADIKAEKKFSHIISFGHSRYGKTALLAAAWSNDIDGAIAHQSGTGGASLFRRKYGESLADITKSYPHWFGKNSINYIDNEDNLPFDQHYLLALLAPKPILLGNARRDVWSDPEGAFRALIAADQIYNLYNAPALTVQRLDKYDPDARLAFWLRHGTHGIVKEDRPAFLDFIEFHFVKP